MNILPFFIDVRLGLENKIIYSRPVLHQTFNRHLTKSLFTCLVDTNKTSTKILSIIICPIRRNSISKRKQYIVYFFNWKIMFLT